MVMVMVASSNGHNGRHAAMGIAVASERGQVPDSAASLANFPRWKSRFARSSGYEPERDGPIAPPLRTSPAPCQAATENGAPAADAA